MMSRGGGYKSVWVYVGMTYTSCSQYWEICGTILFQSYDNIYLIVQTTSFKMILYHVRVYSLIWGQNPSISSKSSFVFYWFLTSSMGHVSSSSLVTYHSFCGNSSCECSVDKKSWKKIRNSISNKKYVTIPLNLFLLCCFLPKYHNS